MGKNIQIDNALQPLYRHLSHIASQLNIDPFGFLDPQMNDYYKTLPNYKEISHLEELSKLYLILIDISSSNRANNEKIEELGRIICEARQNRRSIYTAHDTFILGKLTELLEKVLTKSPLQQTPIAPKLEARPRQYIMEGTWNDAVLNNNYLLLEDIFPSPEELVSEQNTGNTILLQGIANSMGEFVMRLLDAVDTHQVNKKSSRFGNTPLILAVSKGWSHVEPTGRSRVSQSQIAMKLLSKGALVNDKDPYGRTALHYACLHRNVEAITTLIRAGASWNIKDINGQTALDYLFYGKTMATDILTNVTGGPLGSTFTLQDSAFFSNNNLALLNAVLPPENQHVRETILFQNKLNDHIVQALLPIYNTIHRIAERESIDVGQLEGSANLSYYQTPEFKQVQDAAALYKLYLKLIPIATRIDPNIQSVADINVDFDMKRAELQSLLTDPLFMEKRLLLEAVSESLRMIPSPRESSTPGVKVFDQSYKYAPNGHDSSSDRGFSM